MIPAGFFRIGWIFNARGTSGPRVNTLGVLYDPTGVIGAPAYESPDFMGEAGGKALELWENNLFNVYADTTSLDAISISTQHGSVTFPAPSGVSGDNTGNFCPPGIAATVQLHSTTLGRKGRGRMFLPDVGEDQVDDGGVLASGYITDVVTNVENALSALDDIVIGTAFETSLDGAHVLHADGSTPSRIISVAVSPTVAYLRRRQRP